MTTNIKEAKKIIKHHIKFFESLKSHINGTDEIQKSRAMFATWCLHKYINNGLMNDIIEAMKDTKES